MKSVRESYATAFGEAQAAAIEAAAEEHANGTNSANRGSDAFKWAVLSAIGFDCIAQYNQGHGITVPLEEFKRWCLEHGNLGSHDGDLDYLALACGIYDEYVRKEARNEVGA